MSLLLEVVAAKLSQVPKNTRKSTLLEPAEDLAALVEFAFMLAQGNAVGIVAVFIMCLALVLEGLEEELIPVIIDELRGLRIFSYRLEDSCFLPPKQSFRFAVVMIEYLIELIVLR
jgi:hypothetical protein